MGPITDKPDRSEEEREETGLSREDLERVRKCERQIGYRFSKPSLLLQALRHTSTQSETLFSNERLEFLGDSVLGLVISEFLYNFLENSDEGTLTQIKSVVVSTNVLAAESRRLGLDELYYVGKGVGKRRYLPFSLLADVFEAVVAAIYLEGGLEAARSFVIRNLFHQILAVCDDRHTKNYKSLLQQHTQKELGITPVYRVLKAKGPDHSKWFEVAALLGDKEWGKGSGKSKKEAEQAAAREALKSLQVEVAEEKPGGEDSAGSDRNLP